MKCENKAKNWWFNTCLIAICSVVGVGFISGAEIWFYFARFGQSSFVGLIFFGFLIYFVLSVSICQNGHKNSKLEKFKTKIMIFGEMAVASAMVSGLFETTRQIFKKWWLLAFLLAIFLMAILFILEKKSYVIYNYILSFFIIFVIIKLFLYNNKTTTQNHLYFNQNFSFKNVIFACLFAWIYVFSNVAEIRPVLEGNTKYMSKNQKKKLCLILSLMLIFLAFTLIVQFFKNESLSNFSMPFLELFKQGNRAVLWVFLIGLTMTMISTADACLIGVKNKINYSKNDKNFVKIIVIILSLIFGQIPFKIFIKKIYPLVAILNFLVFIFEFVETLKSKKFQNNSN